MDNERGNKGKNTGLAAGELHLGLSVGRNAIAASWTIAPKSHCAEHAPIFLGSGTLQYQRAVYAPVGSDDEADADCRFRIYFFQQWIGRGQSLWKLHDSATRAARGLHEGRVFRVMAGSTPDAMFQLGQRALPPRRPRRNRVRGRETEAWDGH